jgi:hypothetical protein
MAAFHAERPRSDAIAQEFNPSRPPLPDPDSFF